MNIVQKKASGAPTRIIIAVSWTVVAFVGMGMAWRAHRAIEELTAAAAGNERERIRFIAAVKRAEEEIEDAARKRAEIRILSAPPSRGLVTQSLPTEVPEPRIGRAALDTPELQARALQTFRAGLSLNYGAFYRALNLDANQMGRFEALQVEHKGRMGDIRATARNTLVDPRTAIAVDAVSLDGQPVKIQADPTITRLRQAEEAEFGAALTTLLGESGYEQLQLFEHTAQSRAFISELAGNLSFTSAPLSPMQSRQLAAALQDGNFSLEISPGTTRWDEILHQARFFLSSIQIQELEALAAKSKSAVARRELTRLILNSRK